MAYIELKNINYSYPLASKPSVRDVNLKINEGEFVGIIGSNGSGKTTLCNVIRGFCPNFYKGDLDGEVLIDNKTLEEIEKNQALAEKIGYIFQNPFTQLSGIEETVYNEIAFGLENIGVQREKMIAQVDNIIQELELQSLKDKNPFSLSGGQQQRVAIASILAMEPDIIIADEPTSQLDPKTSEEIFSILNKFKDKGRTILLVEHNIDLLYEYADRILVVHEGRIILDDIPSKVFSNPKLEEFGVRKPNSFELALELKEKFSLETIPSSEEEVLEVLNSKNIKSKDFSTTSLLEKENDSFVEIRNLSYTYKGNGNPSIKNINLSFNRGETIGIIGQNGAGKTTLVKSICGLLDPEVGSIKIAGKDIHLLNASERSKYVGYVFQNPDDQIFLSTVKDEILYTSKDKEIDEELFSEVIELCNLNEELDSHPYNLPWSTRKFIAIATLLYLNPQVVIFDEPTAGQDVIGNKRLKLIIEKLRDMGKTIIIITHDMEFITEGVDEIIVMNEGEVLKKDIPEIILSDGKLLKKAFLKQPYIPHILTKLDIVNNNTINLKEFMNKLL